MKYNNVNKEKYFPEFGEKVYGYKNGIKYAGVVVGLEIDYKSLYCETKYQIAYNSGAASDGTFSSNIVTLYDVYPIINIDDILEIGFYDSGKCGFPVWNKNIGDDYNLDSCDHIVSYYLRYHKKDNCGRLKEYKTYISKEEAMKIYTIISFKRS